MTQSAPDTLAACVGSDWADAKHAVCLQAAGATKREGFPLEHTPEAIDAWGTTLRTRCNGHPVAVCLERNTGPLVFALRQDDLLLLFPLHPLTLARYRDAFTPSRAKDAPTDAALPLALRLPHRDTRQPLPPQRPAMRALEPLVAPRRRVVGDKVRSTQRLTSTLNNYVPHGLQWVPDQATPIFCAFLRRGSPLKAAPLARRATLGPRCRDQQVSLADMVA